MATVEAVAPERLLTIEEYEKLPPSSSLTELVRGRVIPMNPPFPWHGFVCTNVNVLCGGFIKSQDRGYAMGNDSGVITSRNPDSLRGADFAFYSYDRVPKGTLKKKGYLSVAPDLVIEVRSAEDRWKDILAKVAEYLEAGVLVVVVLDPSRRTATVYEPDQPERTLGPEETLELANVLPGFAVEVGKFFE